MTTDQEVANVEPVNSYDEEPVHEDLIRLVAMQNGGLSQKKRKNFNDPALWEAGAENGYHSQDVHAATSGANGNSSDTFPYTTPPYYIFFRRSL